MADKVFIEGMSLKEVHIEKVPWVKARIGIKLDKFVDFAKQHVDERGWMNITLAESKAGELYMALDQWKPNQPREEVREEVVNDVGDDEIPF